MKDCLFCKIARKEVLSDVIYEDDDFFAFKDINPKAPIHFLIIPRKHIPSINQMEAKDKELIGKLFLIVQKITKDQGVFGKGYRLIINVGKDAGQAVDHLHLHLLAGKTLPWPQ